MAIGFNSYPPKKASPAIVDPGQILITTDSGIIITMKDAWQHFATFGATGSRKTSNSILPMAEKLINAGFGGLIPDIKGNVYDQIYHFAVNAGREGDIVQFGTSKGAVKTNLLANMPPHELHNFFYRIVMHSFGGLTHNMDFHAKGVKMLVDICVLLNYLHSVNKKCIANLCTIDEMLNDYLAAAKLWQYFLNNVYDANDKDQKRFVNSVKSNPFHLFLESDESRKNKERNDQLAYATGAARVALREVMDVPGIIPNFCAPDGMGIDFRKMHAEGKLILPRFAPDSGPVGAWISRYIINKYYDAVYMQGMGMEKKSFVMIDEFQEVADLSSSKYSDTSFASLCRQFNCMFVVAAQSVSSLIARGSSLAAILSFLDNMHNKLFFFTNDAATMSIAENFNPPVPLSSLKAGEAVLIHNNTANGTHDCIRATFNKCYDKIKDIVAIKALHESAGTVPDSGYSLIDLAEWAENEDKKGGEERRRQRRDSILSRASSTGVAIRSVSADKINKSLLYDDNRNVEVTGCDHGLLKKFPEMFAIEEDSTLNFEIPAGWVSTVEKVFLAYSEAGLDAKIKSLCVHDGKLVAYGMQSRVGRHSLELLSGMLEVTRNVCMVCGKKIDVDKNSNNKTGIRGFCQDCLKNYGFIEPGEDSAPETR